MIVVNRNRICYLIFALSSLQLQFGFFFFFSSSPDSVSRVIRCFPYYVLRTLWIIQCWNAAYDTHKELIEKYFWWNGHCVKRIKDLKYQNHFDILLILERKDMKEKKRINDSMFILEQRRSSLFYVYIFLFWICGFLAGRVLVYDHYAHVNVLFIIMGNPPHDIIHRATVVVYDTRYKRFRLPYLHIISTSFVLVLFGCRSFHVVKLLAQQQHAI